MQEIFDLIMNNLFEICLFVVSFITTLARTSSKSLSNKIDLSSVEDYYVVVDGKEYKFTDLTFYKKKSG